jgi:hypothetical protein
MATSGNFTGSTSNQYITPKIEWSCKQSVVGNYSDVTADLYYKKSSSSTSATSGTLKCSLTINGDKKSAEVSSFNIPANNTYQKAMSHTVRVAHNSDGTKSISISCTGYISGTTLDSTTCKSTVQLTTIPRASTIAVPSVNVGSACNITIKRASSNFTHTISYAFGNKSGTIATKTTASSLEWTVPDTFYEEMASAKSKTGKMKCITYNGSTEIGTSETTFTVLVSEQNVPTLNPKVYVSDTSDTYKLTGSTTKLIRYYTWATYEINAVAKNGASIVSQRMANGDIVYNEASAMMKKAIVTDRFVFSATDSRGYSATKEVIADIVEYIKLTCDLGDYSFSSDGKLSFSIKGKYFNGSFGATNNTLTLKYRYKKVGESYSSWQTKTATINGNSYEATVEIKSLDYLSSYTIQAQVSDKLDVEESREMTLVCVPTFDWGKTSFNFNVPIKIMGNSLADYVVERGTYGIWTYEKWNSGKAELFGRVGLTNIPISTAMGSWYRSDYVFSDGSNEYPFTFKETPIVTTAYTNTNNLGAFFWIGGAIEMDCPPTGYLVRHDSGYKSSGYVNYHVVGKWK